MADRATFKTTMQAKTKIPSTSITPPRPSSPVTLIKIQEMMDTYAEKIMLRVKEFTRELMEELEKQILEKVKDVIKELAEFADEVSERVDQQEKKCDASHEELKVEISKLQAEVTKLQFERSDFALRIRNLPEENRENLKEKISSALVPVLDCDQKVVMGEIETVYRVNSKVAEQRNLPRDVVIYFCRKACRNQVIQKYYQKRFQIADFNIILLKEIPASILQKRKGFLFLTQELRRRKILFRWNIPVGLTVTWNNKRHKLNTVQEAKDFYTLLSDAGAFQAERMVELSNLLKDSLSIQDAEDLQTPEARKETTLEARKDTTQIMTRAMYKQKILEIKGSRGGRERAHK